MAISLTVIPADASVTAVGVGVATSSIPDATQGTSGTLTLSFSGPGTFTAAATIWPAGYSMTSAGVISWTADTIPGIYEVTITPTSSTAGAGTPKTFQFRVVGSSVSDGGAWSPLLRKRIA